MKKKNFSRLEILGKHLTTTTFTGHVRPNLILKTTGDQFYPFPISPSVGTEGIDKGE